jgi:hypothetical protein
LTTVSAVAVAAALNKNAITAATVIFSSMPESKVNSHSVQFSFRDQFDRIDCWVLE